LYRHRKAEVAEIFDKFKHHDEVYAEKSKDKSMKHAMVIGGDSLTQIENNPELKAKFLAFSSKMEVVIACRVSPRQKAVVVKLVKS